MWWWVLFQGQTVHLNDTWIVQNDCEVGTLYGTLFKRIMCQSSTRLTKTIKEAVPCTGASCYLPTMPFISNRCSSVTAAGTMKGTIFFLLPSLPHSAVLFIHFICIRLPSVLKPCHSEWQHGEVSSHLPTVLKSNLKHENKVLQNLMSCNTS